MTGQMLFMPGLGGTTSAKIVIRRAGSPGRVFMPSASMVISPSVDAAVDAAGRALRNDVRDRLAELREAAARRSRTMPLFEDSDEVVEERADLVEAFEVLQVETNAWHAED